MRRLPHPLVLLLACTALAALLSWVLPAGEYERRDDPATGRRVVVAGTYHRVDPAPVTPFQAVVAVPRGLADAASVAFLILLVGGAFIVVDRTGALARGVDALAHRLRDRGALVIPLSCLLFAAGGVLQGMQEEVIALVPVLILLVGRFGYDALVAVAMSLGAAVVGGAFSPLNPFGVGIAQKVAELPLLSGAGFRVAFLAVALALWIAWTMRYARRTRVAVEGVAAEATVAAAEAGGAPPASQSAPVAPADRHHSPAAGAHPPLSAARTAAILLLVLAAFAIYVHGAIRLGWEFEQMGALFLVVAIVAGLLGGLGIGGTAEAYMEGFREMAGAAVLVGAARAIFVVLDQGRIIDTIVDALVAPLAPLPTTLAALGMMGVQVAIHVPVPSTSGQAVLTMPVLVPLSDLIQVPRQVTVLAYQYGAGLCDLVTPTNGAVMAILAAAGVRYDRWLKFCLVPLAALLTLGGVAVATGIAIGLR